MTHSVAYSALSVTGILMAYGLSLSVLMGVCLQVAAMTTPSGFGIAIPVIVSKRCMDILTGYGPSPTALIGTSLLPGVPTRQCVYGIQAQGVVLQRCKGIAVGSDR